MPQGGSGGHSASQVQTLSITSSASCQTRGGTGKSYPTDVFESGLKKAALRNLAAKIVQPTYMTGSIYDGAVKWAQNGQSPKNGLEYSSLIWSPESNLGFDTGLMGWEMATTMQQYYPWSVAAYPQTWRWGYRISRGSSTRPLTPVSGCSISGDNTPQSGDLAANDLVQSCYEYNVLSNCQSFPDDCGFNWNINEQMCVCDTWGWAFGQHKLVPWNQCPTQKQDYTCSFRYVKLSSSVYCYILTCDRDPFFAGTLF